MINTSRLVLECLGERSVAQTIQQSGLANGEDVPYTTESIRTEEEVSLGVQRPREETSIEKYYDYVLRVLWQGSEALCGLTGKRSRWDKSSLAIAPRR
jgi:hypothetical protein